MKTTFRTLLTLCLVLPCMAEDKEKEKEKQKDPTHDEAVAILKKVDAAAKAVKSVSYKADFKGTGYVASRTPNVTGTVLMVKSEATSAFGTMLEKFLVEGEVRPTDSAETYKLTAGSDGDMTFLVDYANKIAYEDMDQAVLGSRGRPLQFLITREFAHPTPFSDEINGDSLVLKGTTTVGGEECYEIHVIYAGGRGESHWCFSKKDYLPRRRYIVSKNPAGEIGMRQSVLTNLKLNPKLTDDMFKLKLPDGFEKSDDYAP